MTFNFHNTTAFVGHKAALILTRLFARFHAGRSGNAPCTQGYGDNRPATPGVYALLAGVPTDRTPH